MPSPFANPVCVNNRRGCPGSDSTPGSYNNTPHMERITVRRTQAQDDDQGRRRARAKRTWTGIGWICIGCGYSFLDDEQQKTELPVLHAMDVEPDEGIEQHGAYSRRHGMMTIRVLHDGFRHPPRKAGEGGYRSQSEAIEMFEMRMRGAPLEMVERITGEAQGDWNKGKLEGAEEAADTAAS